MILVGAITTPPACLPVFRVMPSSLSAISQISAASSLSGLDGLVTISLSCGSASIDSSKVKPKGLVGIIFERRSAKP